MKNKKLFLPAIILAGAIFAILAFSIIFSIAKKPTIKEGEFPFSITYELDGEKVTINGVYKARYDRNDGYADTKTRVYVGEMVNSKEDTTVYTLKNDKSGRIELWTYFYPDYLMGDPEYDYFDEEPFEPKIYYFDSQETEYHDEQTLAAQGVKLISFEYPTPIKNTLVFSHISHFSGEIVLPTLLIAFLSLVAMLIFVKKEKDLEYKNSNIISILFNYVICVIALPYATVLGVFIDINGGGPELYYQIMYFIPAFIVLCIAAAVALCRKGYGVKAIIAQFTGPVAFIVYLFVCTMLNLI